MKHYQLEKGFKLNNRYEICNVIGQGGFGITYVARDLLMSQEIVIKEYFPKHTVCSREYGSVLTSEKESFDKGKKKFLSEAQTLAALYEVPGVVKVLDFFEENNTAYIVMEYVKGTPLDEWIQSRDKLYSFKEACQFLEPVIDALDKIHKKGLIHRDVSPDNIKVTETGDVKLLDFGASRKFFAEQDLEKTLTIMFKEGYAPPEQYISKGKQGPWTDIYALCGVIYEMMTGTMPQNSVERQMSDQMFLPSEFGAEIPSDKEDVFMRKGLSLTTEERYASVRQMKSDFFGEVTEEKETTGINRWLIAAIAIIIVVIVAISTTMTPSEINMGEPAAGSYDRNSEKYNEFIDFVTQNAVSKKAGFEDGSIVYTLQKQDVIKWGEQSNRITTGRSVNKIIESLKASGYILNLAESTENYTVTVLSYGIIHTDFCVTEKYNVDNSGVITIEYDVVSRKPYNINFYNKGDANIDICKFACELYRAVYGELPVEMDKKIREMYVSQKKNYDVMDGIDIKDMRYFFWPKDGDLGVSISNVFGPPAYWP